jgi:hypothetical protein
MRTFKFRRLIATTLTVVMILAMISIIPVSANDSSNISFYSQSAQLIEENWSEDYFGSIVMKINESVIIIDGEEKEISLDDTNPLSGWGFVHTLTLNAGQSWSGFVGTGGNVSRTYTITSTGWTSAPAGIALNQNNTSATANVGTGVNGRVAISLTAPANRSVTVTLSAIGGTTNANDPALFNSAGARIAYQNNRWGFTHTLTINAGQSWSGFIGTGGDVARSYNLTSTWSSQISAVTLTQSNTSATANVGTGINGRIPITVTAPSTNSITVSITAPGGTSNANDPALYNSAGTRIAYQNNGWGFIHTITLNAGQSWSGFVGTGDNVARLYTLSSTFKS